MAKAPSSQDKASLTVGEQTTELPVHHGSIGPDVVDITSLYKTTGLFTHDPGFMSTSACESKITFIDGEKGVLLHRGYDIEDLAEKSDYMEVSYLLLNDDLPTAKEKEVYSDTIKHHTMVHEQISTLYHGFPRRSHPMAILVGAVASLSAFYHDSLDINDPEQRELAAHRIIAKMPTLIAYKYLIGQPIMFPKNDLSYAGNFLQMMFGVPCETYVPNPILERAIDKILVLHADHEQNASTSTIRLASSSGANPFACIGAAISSLWGPYHGGANEAVIAMLKDIGDVRRIPEFIEKAKDKNDPFRLMGFGHRVYKNYDPRAKVLKSSCDEVLEEVGIKHSPILKIAKELERIALEDEYFIERKLFPNVDFYSGIIYQALGIPTTLFTGIFAMSRAAGWIAQWKEMLEDPDFKIGRPRQLYTGPAARKFVPLKKRK